MVFTDLQSLNTYRVSINIHKHHVKLYMMPCSHMLNVCPYSTGWRLLQSLGPQSGTVNRTMVSRVTFSFSTTNIYTHTHTLAACF